VTHTAYAPVVAGVDGSGDTRPAVEQAAREAVRRRAALRLVYASSPLAPRWGPPEVLADLHAWDAERCRNVLTTAAEWAGGIAPDTEVQTVTTVGGAAGVLVAESRRAALTVVGTHARGGVSGHLSASVACQVAAHAAGPVLVVRSAVASGRRAVVVGVDGSPSAEAALARAVEEAAARDGYVVAVYAWTAGELGDRGILRPDDGDVAGDVALRLLTEATDGYGELHPDVVIRHRVVQEQHPARALSDTAADTAAGLIVVGARGHGGFLGLRLGATADALIRHTDVPVLVIRDQYPGPG
jgi:nucleotide-binding universal stress UspA family protein